ncbi:MAG: AtpZ/AtpI family protein [Lewinella sp.]|nr:AtpZ/AtpI family protein [Lewinella sp.]
MTTDQQEPTTELGRQVASQAKRKLRARHRSTHGFWQSVSMFGLIGWSVTVPTLLGIGLGVWLDKHYPAEFSWTLALLVAGLLLGCFNAWYWVDREHRTINEELENDE